MERGICFGHLNLRKIQKQPIKRTHDENDFPLKRSPSTSLRFQERKRKTKLLLTPNHKSAFQFLEFGERGDSKFLKNSVVSTRAKD